MLTVSTVRTRCEVVQQCHGGWQASGGIDSASCRWALATPGWAVAHLTIPARTGAPAAAAARAGQSAPVAAFRSEESNNSMSRRVGVSVRPGGRARYSDQRSAPDSPPRTGGSPTSLWCGWSPRLSRPRRQRRSLSGSLRSSLRHGFASSRSGLCRLADDLHGG